MAGVPRDAWAKRWRRRAFTVPAVLVGALLWLAATPFLVVLAFAIDLVRRKRFATLRMWIFVGAYLWGEVAGLLLLLFAWLRSGLGRDREQLRSLAYEVQREWLRTLWRATTRIYSLEVAIERPKVLPLGPFIVLVRHTSMIDTIIPGVILGADYKVRLRYVLKRELLVDPCLDIAGHWMPNHYVDRSGANRKRELESLRALATGMAEDEGVLLYPEGTRFSPARRKRALTRLAQEDRYLHGMALRCHNTLPPRPGGTLALLNGAPRAHVLVVQHAGFLGFTEFSDLWKGGLTGRKITVRIEHIPREEVPAEAEARVRWLFDRWARVDAWVSTRESRHHDGGTGSHRRARTSGSHRAVGGRPRTTGSHRAVGGDDGREVKRTPTQGWAAVGSHPPQTDPPQSDPPESEERAS